MRRLSNLRLVRWCSTIAPRTILIPTALPVAAKSLLEKQGFHVVLDSKTSLASLCKDHPNTYGLIVRSEKIDDAVLNLLPNLKVICRAGAGYDTIDTKGARRRGIDVMNTPGANANGVAEEVVAMALAAFRHVVAADVSTRAGHWEKTKFLGKELANKTVGIVGLGAIGQLVAKRMGGFDCKFLGTDPLISPSKAEELKVKLVPIEKLFSESDVITLHLPATNETTKLINKHLLGLMKEGACLINCARQDIVDEDDLRALKATKKFTYCTDVYVKDAPGDKPIKDVADLMLPHLGANTSEANLNAATRAASQIVDWAKEGVKKYVVNRSVPEDLDENYQKLAYFLARVGSQFLGPLQPQSVETTFYGDLQKHSQWLSPSVVLGLSPTYDSGFDSEDATAFLGKMGITYTCREMDESKRYGEAITVDLISGSGENFEKVSVRGTVAEGRPIISRINGFEGLYFNPTGTTLMVEYTDRPGVLAIVTSIIAQYGINIKDVRAPQDTEVGRSLAVFLLETSEKGMPPQAVKDIKAAVGAVRAILVEL